MSLSVGLDVAVSGLTTTAEHTSIVSRNVARANDPNATRKIANIVTAAGGGVRIASVTRAANASLLEKMLGATSTAAAQRAVVEALGRLNQTADDPELDRSPAAMIQKLGDAIQQFAAAPHDSIRAQSAVSAAQNLAVSLNDATGTVQDVRAQADAGIGDAVDRLNTLLARFEALNNEIVKGTRIGADVTDYLDQRDALLAEMSEDIGIRTLTRANNDMAVFTDSGVTLFDVRARSVTFERTLFYTPGTSGNAVYVDGVPVVGAAGPMQSASGRLVGLAAARDNVAVAYQNQLDEIARGLIEAFAESDQSAVPTLADAPGLFTYPGAPAMPATGTLMVGLAGSIAVSASVDPAQGGDLALLRDGGMAGDPAYIYNVSGGSGYGDRLDQYIAALSAQRSFDPAVGLAPTATLGGFASSSVAWLQETRRSAGDDAAYAETLLQRSSDALSKETGVNIDEEMTTLLELERSYQASSRLISSIDNMLRSLLAAAG
jgi:flagellar hook-associated protein 1 FlgK